MFFSVTQNRKDCNNIITEGSKQNEYKYNVKENKNYVQTIYKFSSPQAFPRLSGEKEQARSARAGDKREAQEGDDGNEPRAQAGNDGKEKREMGNPCIKNCKTLENVKVVQIARMAEYLGDEAPLTSLEDYAFFSPPHHSFRARFP